jgi:tetratricopeptide (TPR) repeat protein
VAPGQWPYLVELAAASGRHHPEAIGAVLADPAAARVRIEEAFVGWLDALAGLRPAVLVVEDLHWADTASIALMSTAARTLTGRALLLIATARPDPLLEGVWRSVDAQVIRLGALTPRAALRLARQCVGAAADDAALEVIVARAHGNPFHLRELCRWHAGGQRLDQVPESLLAVTLARLESLDGAARRPLRAASIHRGAFDIDDLAHLLGGERERASVAAWVPLLCQRELLIHAGGGLYRFIHALLRDACYATLTPEDTRVGHQLAAELLGARDDADPAIVAEHFLHAELAAEAVPWLARAASNATRAGDLSRSVELAERGIAAGAEGALLGELFATRAAALGWLGRFDESLEPAERAMKLLEPASPMWFRAGSTALVASASLGRPELGVGVVARLVSLERTPTPSGAYGRSMHVCVTGMLLFGQRQIAADLVERLRRALPSADPVFGLWAHLTQGHFALLANGDVLTALALCDVVDELGRGAGEPLATFMASVVRLRAMVEVGALDLALRAADQAQAAASRLGSDYLRDWAEALRANALVTYGDVASALALMAQRPASVHHGASRSLLSLTQALIALDRGDAAAAAAAIDASQQAGMHVRTFAASISWMRGRLALLAGDAAAALRCCEESVAVMRESGFFMRDLAICELVKIEALRALGRVDEARRQVGATLERLDAVRAALPREDLRRAMSQAPYLLALRRVAAELDG